MAEPGTGQPTSDTWWGRTVEAKAVFSADMEIGLRTMEVQYMDPLLNEGAEGKVNEPDSLSYTFTLPKNASLMPVLHRLVLPFDFSEPQYRAASGLIGHEQAVRFVAHSETEPMQNYFTVAVGLRIGLANRLAAELHRQARNTAPEHQSDIQFLQMCVDRVRRIQASTPTA